MISKKFTSDKEKENRWKVWIMNILIQRMIIQKILMQPNIDELDAQIFYPKENICLLLALYVLKYSHG